jgi:hypothetical protein
VTIVAISYRKEDAEVARGVYRTIAHRLNPSSIFLAEESIPGGTVWEEKVRSAFQTARLVVAIVGKNWLRDEFGSFRLVADDWIRQELEIAYASACPVYFPVLINGVEKPSNFELQQAGPAVINLFRFQIHPINTAHDSEIQNLCHDIITHVLGIQATFSKFPIGRVSNKIRMAENRILVWHNWSEYFETYLKDDLETYLQRRYERHSPRSCRILLASGSSYANARAGKLRGNNIENLVRRTVLSLEEIAGKIVKDGRFEEVLEVRFFDSFPSMPLYVLDDVAFLGWYPPTLDSHSSPYVQISGRASKLLHDVEKMFETAWQSATSRWNFATRLVEPIFDDLSGLGGLPGGM